MGHFYGTADVNNAVTITFHFRTTDLSFVPKSVCRIGQAVLIQYVCTFFFWKLFKLDKRVNFLLTKHVVYRFGACATSAFHKMETNTSPGMRNRASSSFTRTKAEECRRIHAYL